MSTPSPRYGAQFGPDITFLGVPAVDVADAAALAEADVVVVGAPFDGGTSHRPGTRFGPSAIRQTCYLPHDGSRPSLAMRVDGLGTDLRVLDVIPSRGAVVVPVLRTDVIVGGRGAPTAPVEETLRFERRDGVWRLAAGSAR